MSKLSRSRTLPSFSIISYSAADYSLRKFHVHVPAVLCVFCFLPPVSSTIGIHRMIVVRGRVPYRSYPLYQSYSILFLLLHRQSADDWVPGDRDTPHLFFTSAIIASNNPK